MSAWYSGWVIVAAGPVPVPAPPSLITFAPAAGATARTVPRIRVKRALRFIGAFLSFRPSLAVDCTTDGRALAARCRFGCGPARRRVRSTRGGSRSGISDPWSARGRRRCRRPRARRKEAARSARAAASACQPGGPGLAPDRPRLGRRPAVGFREGPPGSRVAAPARARIGRRPSYAARRLSAPGRCALVRPRAVRRVRGVRAPVARGGGRRRGAARPRRRPRALAWTGTRRPRIGAVREAGDDATRGAPPRRDGGPDRSRPDARRARAGRGRTRDARRAQSGPGAPARAADARPVPLRSPGRGARRVPRREARARRRARHRPRQAAPGAGLGIAPEGRRQELERAILRQDASLDLAPAPTTTQPRAGRRAAGIIVGRDRELEELSAALEDASAGRGRLFLISGEGGVGKTRLADELASRAKDSGARILWGRCSKRAGAPAYWPWTQALKSLADDLPELDPPADEDDEAALFRLFVDLAAALKRASAGQPALLVLDDLHRADRSSLLLFEFLAGELAEMHVALVGTYVEGPDVPPELVAFSDHAAHHHLRLGPLRQEDVARFLEQTGAPNEDAGEVFAETGGNPRRVWQRVR